MDILIPAKVSVRYTDADGNEDFFDWPQDLDNYEMPTRLKKNIKMFLSSVERYHLQNIGGA